MGWARRLAALGAAASLAAPLAAGAAPVTGGRRASATLTVTAVVVRSTPVALRPAAVETERAPAAAAARPIALPGAGTAPAARPSGARATVVFIDGEPPSWTLLARPGPGARALGEVLAQR